MKGWACPDMERGARGGRIHLEGLGEGSAGFIVRGRAGHRVRADSGAMPMTRQTGQAQGPPGGEGEACAASGHPQEHGRQRAGAASDGAGVREEGGCSLGQNGPPRRPSWRCRERGSSECVRLLIDVGANLEAHDCHFGTPLHVACAREHLDCVKMLLNAGANVNAAKLHETALHHAAKVKNVDLIEMLVEFGGNIYARDNRGKKPSDYTWSSSAPAKCLEFYEKTPLTLSQLCRVSLRRATGVRGLEKITKLNIPPRLIDYLSYN
ncbi:ankyrin repeat and SOCS box protein 13 isoform X3 [Mustela nigripes]|uniref:ankyrin repeat and SOCS box protein 13 isoform X3 n=1 Tax=Mustela nigripes TaxID=77151 RepID=UPI002814E492|nr:ankyrin repeat and SOCS box protein 13 isoform X3 [Mustela nigripes]